MTRFKSPHPQKKRKPRSPALPSPTRATVAYSPVLYLSEPRGPVKTCIEEITLPNGSVLTNISEYSVDGKLVSSRSERDGQIASLNQSVVDITEEAARRAEWALRLDSELKELQSKLTTILRSNSWLITLPLREARSWVDAPKAQSKRYAKAALRCLKRTYQALPLSAQTKALHRNWIARHAPRLLLAGAAHPTSMSMASISAEVAEDIVSPTSDTPVVSVIVPVCGKIEYTLRCLKSIENLPPRVTFEVIVVDDCSPNNSTERLSKVSGVRLITNTENPGFIRSCNAGAKAARGEYLGSPNPRLSDRADSRVSW